MGARSVSLLFNLLWPVWVLAFFVIEGFALWYDHKRPASFDRGFTLSSHFRRWFSVKTFVGRTIFIVITGVFVAAFVPHILHGGWFR